MKVKYERNINIPYRKLNCIYESIRDYLLLNKFIVLRIDDKDTYVLSINSKKSEAIRFVVSENAICVEGFFVEFSTEEKIYIEATSDTLFDYLAGRKIRKKISDIVNIVNDIKMI